MGVEAVIAIVSHHKNISFRDELEHINPIQLVIYLITKHFRAKKCQNERLPTNTK